jgi:very-short-patch-repair endonuclease
VKGRKGAGTLSRLLRARTECRDSALEVEVHRLCLEAKVPEPAVQYLIVEEGRRIVLADFAWPEVKLAVLAQGYAYHHGARAFERDHHQLSELATYDWRVLLPTWKSIRRNPQAFVKRVQRAHGVAARRSKKKQRG